MNINELTFHAPSLDDLRFREMMLADGAEMSYNRVWTVIFNFNGRFLIWST